MVHKRNFTGDDTYGPFSPLGSLSTPSRNGQGKIRLPSSPQLGLLVSRQLLGSSNRQRLRVLLFFPVLYGLFLLFVHAPDSYSFYAHNPIKALQTYVNSRSKDFIPLQALFGQAGYVSKGGNLVLLSDEIQEEDFEKLLCDILSIVAQDDYDTNSTYKPIVSRQTIFALNRSRESVLTSEKAFDIATLVALDPQCTQPLSENTTTIFNFPSISTITVDEQSLPRLLDDSRPKVVISIEPDTPHVKRLNPEQHEGITWISMPQRDVAHAGWIFSLPDSAVKAWHEPTFKIIMITNDRAESCRRLYNSLRNAHYYGKNVDLDVKIEATADDLTLSSVISWTNGSSPYAWQHGHSGATFRFRQAGLITNIVEAWWPTNNNEYGFFFEDDIEASPYYFAWAKWAILMYRYGPDSLGEAARNVYGISLIQQKTSELDRKTGRILWDATSHLENSRYDPISPYLSQVPSSWGAVFFPQIWREFHDFIQIRDNEDFIPKHRKMIKPSVVSDDWQGSWKRFLIELAFLRGYSMLYPNYRDFTSLSTNHVELGEHIDSEKQSQLRAMQEVPLMEHNMLLDVPRRRMPRTSELPSFDLWGIMVPSVVTLTERGRKAVKDMWHCDTQPPRKSDFNSFGLFGCT